MDVNDFPSPQAQIDFLQNIQRLLDEGLFTATYKYALLLALSDVCVERGENTGATLRVETTWLAEKFVSYYWRQARPYVGHGTEDPASVQGSVLRAASGNPAVVLTTVRELSAGGRSLADAQRAGTEWRKAMSKTARLIRDMPLWRLQKVGNQSLDFLYRQTTGDGTSIELEPGVMFCFRRFHSLVIDLVRGAWVRYVRRLNQDVLGTPADLDQFLFGTERAPLDAYVPILREVQGSRCFYCEREVSISQERTHVDHFVPWSRYPVDLGHNFVLAHERCNLAKADHLAAAEHLAHWVERNCTARAFLSESFAQAKIVHDLPGSQRITRWAYQQAATVQALTWMRGKQLEPLAVGWLDLVGI